MIQEPDSLILGLAFCVEFFGCGLCHVDTSRASLRLTSMTGLDLLLGLRWLWGLYRIIVDPKWQPQMASKRHDSGHIWEEICMHDDMCHRVAYESLAQEALANFILQHPSYSAVTGRARAATHITILGQDGDGVIEASNE